MFNLKKYFVLSGLFIGTFLLLTTTVFAGALAPTSVTYRDDNNDGTVEAIRLTFTDVTACVFENDDWDVGVTGSITATLVTGIANTGTCATDNFITVSITTVAGITGGASNPRIDYVDAVTAGSVVADGNQDAATFTATDLAKPAVMSATWVNTGGKNTLAFVYSEAVHLSRDGGGDADIAAGASGYSTTTLGNTSEDEATIVGFGTWDAASSHKNDTATGNAIALSADGKTATITFNSVAEVYYDNNDSSPLAPTNSHVFTPTSDNANIGDSAGNGVNASKTVNFVVTSFDGTSPNEVLLPGLNAQVNAGPNGIVISWTSISNPGDFGSYLVYVYDNDPDLNGVLINTRTSVEDAALATVTTSSTTIPHSLLTVGTKYYIYVGTSDTEGNSFSDTASLTKVYSASKSSDSTPPSVPTSIAAKVNDDYSVTVTWVDPTATDLASVDLIKSKGTGVAPDMVIAQLGKGTLKYEDKDVKKDEVVNYVMRARDLRGNISAVSTPAVTVTATLTPATTEGAETEEDTTTEEGATTEEGTEGEEIEEESSAGALTYEEEQQTVQDEGIVTENIEKSTNKCELLVMIGRANAWEVDESLTEDGFTDTPDWCAPYAFYARENGIVNGRSETELGMSSDMTRFEFAMVLYRVLTVGELIDEEALATGVIEEFDDDMVEWAAEAVAALRILEVISGYSDNTFRGTNGVLKIEAAVALWRAMQ